MSTQKNIVSSSEDVLRRNSQWQLDKISSIESREDSASDTYYAANDINLYVVQKKQLKSSRPIIPATKCEKLTYIRSYVSFTSKTDVIGIQFINFNVLFWNYLGCAFLKTLPSCYLYLFLGSYARQHHLFLTRMTPLLHGLNILWILIGVSQLFFSTYLQVMFLDFICTGLYDQRPWNRCTNEVYSVLIQHDFINVSCYALDEFIARVSNASSTSTGIRIKGAYFHDTDTDDYFQISQFFNLQSLKAKMKQKTEFGLYWFSVYDNIIWISSLLLINQIFKRSIWKILHVAHWMLAVFFVCILLFIGIYDANNAGFKTVLLTSTPALETKMGLDLDFLAESMTTPPILHILTSRSKEEVKLSTDSALIITSNTFFYLFRAFVVDKLLRYCVYITKVQLHLVYSDSSIFLLWPIFFTSLYLDSIVTIPFSILIFVVDYFTFVITYQCLIEVIVCEWQVLKRWHAAVILYILANVHQQQWFTINNWLIAYGIRSATFTELLIITFLYPLSRLVEDTTFHNGIAPSFVAVISLRLVCLLYIVKFLRSSSLFGIFLPSKWKTGITYALVLILTAGLLVKLYDIVVIKKKNWKLIFVPVKEWGPFDLSLRLLRKKYDSSKYIQSQAPRDLSRYLIQKAEPNSYKLDLRYGLPPKSMLYVRP